MATTVTQEQVVEAAKSLSKPEFTRNDIAGELGVKPADLKEGFKSARQARSLEKVGEDDSGKGRFRLTAQ